MTLSSLITRRSESTQLDQLAMMSLRYEATRALSAEQFYMLIRASILDHDPGESYEDAFDRNIDRVVLHRASEKGPEL